MGRAQGNEGAVVEAQVYKGTAAEAHDTIGAIRSLRDVQGAVVEAHVIQGDTAAREYSIDG